MGVVAWDDVSETDPAFRSGANAKQMFVPGLVALPDKLATGLLGDPKLSGANLVL